MEYDEFILLEPHCPDCGHMMVLTEWQHIDGHAFLIMWLCTKCPGHAGEYVVKRQLEL